MQHDDPKIAIPKLLTDGTNWVIYRDRFLWAMDNNLLNVHIENEDAPSDYANSGTVNGLDAATRWKKGEGIVKQLIAATVPDTVFARIKKGTRAKDVWDSLKKYFEERTKMTVVDLARRFRNKKCGEKENVRTHFEQLANMREQLAAMGKVIDDDDFTDILLASLPPTYESTRSAINASARISGKTLTPDTVIQLFIDNYEQRGSKDQEQDEAFTADAQRKKNIECYNCKKRGHIRADCWAKGGGKEGQGPTRGGRDSGNESTAAAQAEPDIEAWAAIEEVEEERMVGEEDQQYAAIAASDARTSGGVESELYDSGASRHMSPFRHRFVSYRPIDPRPITAADKRVFYAVGTGDLQVEVPNGESSSSVVLRDVLHAPDMALTIVSISRITKAGCAVSFEGDACKIKNKAGKVIGVVPASANGLYRVDHSVVAGAAIETVSLLTLHMLRFGHVSLLFFL